MCVCSVDCLQGQGPGQRESSEELIPHMSSGTMEATISEDLAGHIRGHSDTGVEDQRRAGIEG